MESLSPNLPRQGRAAQEVQGVQVPISSKCTLKSLCVTALIVSQRKAGLTLLVVGYGMNHSLDGLGDVCGKDGKILLQPAERTDLSLLVFDFPSYKIFYRDI